jgi:hypothetical protein
MDDYQTLGLGNLAAVLLNGGRQGRGGGNLPARQQGIKSFGVKVMKNDLIPVKFQGLDNGFGNGVIETSLLGMGQDDADCQV